MRNAALGIVLNSDRTQVLLVQRDDVPVWVLPGGGIDDGESAADAACREAHEETGLQVQVVREGAHYRSINRFTSDAHVFVCEQINGVLTAGHECRDAAFFALDRLPSTLFPFHREWLMEILASERKVQKAMSRGTFWKVIWYCCRRPHWALNYLFTRFRKS